MHEIIPAILPHSVEELEKSLAELPGSITFFHMDVLEEDIWTDKNTRDFEVHLMVEDPDSIIERWIKRGAKRVSIHKPSAALVQYRDRAEIGYAVEIDRPLEEFMPFFDFVDFIHLMSIDDIGKQGEPLDDKIFGRVKLLQEKFPDKPISVDGGVNLNNYQKLLDAGTDRLVVGSHFKEIWNSLTSA